jgi:hypothetical protein
VTGARVDADDRFLAGGRGDAERLATDRIEPGPIEADAFLGLDVEVELVARLELGLLSLRRRAKCLAPAGVILRKA